MQVLTQQSKTPLISLKMDENVAILLKLGNLTRPTFNKRMNIIDPHK